MPALISGRRISNARPLNHSELLVTLADTQETVTWSSLPNLFTEARSSGFNTTLIGYYHPYCRVLRNSLTTCSSWGAPFLVWKQSAVFTLPEAMLNQVAQALNAIPFARRAELPEKLLKRSRSIQAKRGELYVQFYRRMVDEFKKVLTSRHDGLVFLHLPVPHVPFIYDRLTGQLVVEGSKSYLDNLALADRTLGELRRAMEEQGIWEDAAILVTSDHWYRNKPSESFREQFAMRTLSDKRIPLLLKLPGEKRQVKYEAAFNSIIIHDLLLALLTDTARFAHPEEIVEFLDTNRSIAPPLCEGWPLRLEKQAAAGCLNRLPEPIQERDNPSLLAE
jgi:hypothetical protein